MTVVLLRGTNGSGKTYIAQTIMQEMRARAPHEVITLPPDGVKRKRDTVIGYCWHNSKVTVMGRYETATGGCDSLNWSGAANDLEAHLVAEHEAGKRHVFMEGLIISSWGIERLKRVQLATGALHIIDLDTSLDMCIDSVHLRRGRVGNSSPLNETNLRLKYRSIETSRVAIKREGLRLEQLPRDAALDRVRQLLELVS